MTVVFTQRCCAECGDSFTTLTERQHCSECMSATIQATFKAPPEVLAYYLIGDADKHNAAKQAAFNRQMLAIKARKER